MPSIKILKEKFDDLPFSSDTIDLYIALLNLDISDFKPLMEEIFSGRLDIEDTRKIFSNYYLRSIKSFNSDPLTSTDIVETIKNNIANSIFNNGKDVVKETVVFPDISDLKKQIADVYKEENGTELSEEDIEKILPIVETAIIADLSMFNDGPSSKKERQLILADYMSYKPDATI